MRTATLPPTDREWDRSYFNLAGPYIERAQVEPARAEAHLTQAEIIYKAVLDIREERERGPHTHIAACYHGRALVDYYRALLVASDRGVRTRLLRTATEAANEALRQRELFDGGWDNDAAKTASLLAKIHVARNALNAAKGTLLASHLVEIEREVLGADLVRDDRPGRLALQGPLRLTADTKLREFIDAWAGSVALMTLLRAFGATPPPTELPASERLRALYALSELWDFRRGAERGRGRRPPLTDEQLQVTQAATRALGLHDTAAPADPRLDQIVVLGGLARACLARPARVAHLLGRGTLDAPRITLLGAFRPTDAGERALLRELLGHELAHEHAVLMTGAGRAFGIAPDMEVVERGGVGPQAWEVTAASTPDGRMLDVCAAPIPPGEARATTSSSLEWLRDRGRLAVGGRILFVTTYHYRVHQIAQALRVVGLGLGAKVDALGVRPGDADPRLEFEPDVYDLLGEVRSTIGSLRALHAALD